MNSSFGLLYDVVRSLRGVVIFLTYVCKRSVLVRLRDRVLGENTGRLEEFPRVSPPQDQTRRFPPAASRNERSYKVGQVNSTNTTNTHIDDIGLQNRAFTIDEMNTADLVDTSGSPESIELPYVGHSRALSIAKAIGADLIEDSEGEDTSQGEEKQIEIHSLRENGHGDLTENDVEGKNLEKHGIEIKREKKQSVPVYV